MKRVDIIRMAREAGICDGPFDFQMVSLQDLERFAAIVSATEREACASLVQSNAEACDTFSTSRRILESNAAAIRARSAL